MIITGLFRNPTCKIINGEHLFSSNRHIRRRTAHAQSKMQTLFTIPQSLLLIQLTLWQKKTIKKTKSFTAIFENILQMACISIFTKSIKFELWSYYISNILIKHNFLLNCCARFFSNILCWLKVCSIN